MFVYQSRFFSRGEVWFNERPNGRRVDWIYHRQRSSPLVRGRWKHFHTWLIDLQKTPTDLLSGMDGKTVQRIEQARGVDKLRCEQCDARAKQRIDEVERMWNQFAQSQNTPILERHWLEPMSSTGVLDLVAAKDAAHNVLVYHLVFRTPHRARQLIAISPYKAVPTVAWRNAVSRANCLVHWHNFLRFQEEGVREFDFGGWHVGTTDIRLLGINRFKSSFGGRVVREHDGEEPVTTKGWVLLTLTELSARLRQGPVINSRKTPRERDAAEIEQRKVSPAL